MIASTEKESSLLTNELDDVGVAVVTDGVDGDGDEVCFKSPVRLGEEVVVVVVGVSRVGGGSVDDAKLGYALTTLMK